ncbi:MAG TPA: RNA polymerase sigma-70 factor [Chitinophagaceae bacterium]|jgi:RNA polymerase sigma-70 factor (ECF subfamily)
MHQDYRSYTDLDLASLLMEGDHGAYTELYQRFKGVLYVHAFRMLQNKDDAKDIVQELFTVLWTKRADLTFRSGVAAYLYTAVRHRVFDHISHKKVESRFFESLKDFVPETGYLEDELLHEKELSALIERETAALPDKMRQIFELSRKVNLSHKEIAEQLLISDKTVKKQVGNALRILRLKLGDAFFFFTFL